MLTSISPEIQEALVAIFVIFMMISVGVDLTIDKLKEVFHSPKMLTIGLVVNYLVIPLILYSLVRFLEVPGWWGVGLLFVAAAPGGPVAAVMVQNAKGHLELGVSLMVVMNLLNAVLTPLLIYLMDVIPSETGSEVSLWGMIRTIVMFQIIPLSMAVYYRYRFESKALWLQPRLKKASQVLLAILAVGITASEFNSLWTLPTSLLIACNVGVFASIVISYAITPGLRDDKIAISLTSTFRSISIALLLLAAWVQEVEAILGTMAYSGTMLWMCWLASFIMKRKRR
ncbi:MAG: bile acid:sodium symporter family protein [Myxococcota bacterium]